MLKALVYDEYCVDNDFASILKIREVPEPTPKSNEVIFRVRAAALNYDDIWGMRGAPLKVPLDRKSTRLNSSHSQQSRMPSSA